ncbi:DUF6129 family protein [Neiella marina]|nr:DUF6129 family protein [Neiella marina]
MLDTPVYEEAQLVQQFSPTPESSSEQLSMAFLNELADMLIAYHPSWQTVQWLRQRFPAIRFLLCSEDDMADREPFLGFEEFGFYLMAGGWGCASLTEDIDKSVGVIIATVES